MTRRSHPRLTPERRAEPPPQWKGKPVFWPIVALLLALSSQLSSSEVVEPQVGKGITISKRDGSATDCWLDVGPLERFCATHTTERR